MSDPSLGDHIPPLKSLLTTHSAKLVVSNAKKLSYYICLKSDLDSPVALTKNIQKRNDVVIVSTEFVLDSVDKGVVLDATGYFPKDDSVGALGKLKNSVVVGSGDDGKKRKSGRNVKSAVVDLDDGEHEEDEKPAKKRNVDAGTTRKSARNAKPVAVVDQDDEEDEPPKTQSVDDNEDTSKKRKSTRKTKQVTTVDQDEEEEPPKTQSVDDNDDTSKKRKSTRKTKKVVTVQDDEEEEAEEEENPKKRGKKAKDAEHESTPTLITAPSIDESPKMKTLIKKGKAVVDEYFPQAAACHVYEAGGVVYDSMLNQTEIGNNNNKFYKIQVIQSDSNPNQFWAYNRWGRVGVKGQTAQKPYTSAASAIADFKGKFRDKTKNDFDDRENFVKYPNKYQLIEMDYGDEEEEQPEEAKAETLDRSLPPPKTEIPKSALDERVQDVIKMLFNVDTMNSQMVEIGYDANRMPLGKLTKRSLMKGFEVLNRVSDVLNSAVGNQNALLTQLSSEFYTYIPHNFGMNRPPLISTMEMVKRKIQMLETLSDLKIASTLLAEIDKNMSKNPIDANYEKLKCELNPIEKGGEEWNLIEEYTQNTHAETHNSYALEILDVFKVSRDSEQDRFAGLGGPMGNHQLLWHGSRLTNFVGILSQGLRIAPPEAPVTGYMFGKGVYFANMVSKGANYCFTSRGNDTGFMLLCEVALGEENHLMFSDYNAEALMKKNKKTCTKGVGATYPDPSMSKEINGDYGKLKVPVGKPKKDGNKSGALLYDEYIVYDVGQIQMKYIFD
ncbi:Poly [ADP-ribose] polymerase 2 [Nowakowskiella sp. JEL0407]|nr:Poly [ADP-ribose] polymerase 2 [Nowakowskiella sp. JEL0407]